MNKKIEQERRAGYGPDGPWVGVIALDPGKTTGVAWCRAKVAVLRDDGWMNTLQTRLMLGGIEGGTGEIDCTDIVTGVGRLVDAVVQIGADGARRYVVVEDFALYAGRRHVGKDALWSPRVAAALEVVCGLIDRIPDSSKDRLLQATWVYQPPSERNVITDARLKQWKLYVPGDHARDALRHLIVWLRKQKWETWFRSEKKKGR